MADTLARAFKRGANLSGSFDASQLKLFDNLSTDSLVTMIKADPTAFAPAIKNMDDADVSSILKRLDESDQVTIINRIDPDGVRNFDGLGSSAKRADQANNTMTIMAGAGALGLAYYIDNKYSEAKEEFKDCMAGCLPHNWDEYEQGGISKNELKYSTVDSLEEYGVTPIENQPYCTTNMDNCDTYCKGKCDEETDVDLPGMDGLEGLTKDLSEGLGGIIGNIFGGLFTGLGIDNTTAGIGSSASSVMICCMFIVLIMVKS